VIHREFLLVNDTAWKHCVNFVESNRKPLEADSPLRIIITTQEEKRRSEQNRYYWKCVIGSIADQVWVSGQQFSKDAWHELLAGQFGVKVDSTKKVHLWIEFYPKTKRKVDDANCLAAFKSYRDGIADALGVNDSMFQSHPVVMAETGGKMVVRLEQ
jgi:hypothetical protein